MSYYQTGFALLLLALSAFQPLAASRDAAEVDYLELAALLTRDGNYERAEAALRNVDVDDAELDLIKFHSVSGLLALHANRLADAVDAFTRAVAAGQQEPLIHLYLAQAHFGLEQYREALQALTAAGDAADSLSGAWLMRAHAHWMLGERAEGLAVLDAASLRFPANSSFQRRQVFYLVELGLHQQAAEIGQQYLARTEGSEEDYVAIGDALRRGGQYTQALEFLEVARLKFPGRPNPTRALAQTWLDMGHPLAAAELYAGLSRSDPRLLAEAVELYRRAGRLFRALELNTQVADSQQKLRQRVGLLIELQRYDLVTGMEDALFRAGLLNDEDIRYALAYAWFKAGEHALAETHLTALTRSDLFRRATELRRVMEECAQERWRCG